MFATRLHTLPMIVGHLAWSRELVLAAERLEAEREALEAEQARLAILGIGDGLAAVSWQSLLERVPAHLLTSTHIRRAILFECTRTPYHRDLAAESLLSLFQAHGAPVQAILETRAWLQEVGNRRAYLPILKKWSP